MNTCSCNNHPIVALDLESLSRCVLSSELKEGLQPSTQRGPVGVREDKPPEIFEQNWMILRDLPVN